AHFLSVNHNLENSESSSNAPKIQNTIRPDITQNQRSRTQMNLLGFTRLSLLIRLLFEQFVINGRLVKFFGKGMHKTWCVDSYFGRLLVPAICSQAVWRCRPMSHHLTRLFCG